MADPSDRDVAFTLSWVRSSGLFVDEGRRASALADAIADGYLVAALVRWARPDLLDSVHSFERGRHEAARNWQLLRARVVSRLPGVSAACAAENVEVLLRGKDAAARGRVATAILCKLRRGLRLAERPPKRKPKAPAPAVDPATIDARYLELRHRFECSTRVEELERLERRSAEFDSRIAALRRQNLQDLAETERKLERLRVAPIDTFADATPPPPPDAPPPAHCVPVARPTLITTYRRFDESSRSHYYEDAATGGSSWTAPETGLIHALDDVGDNPTNAAFYIEARTSRVAWTLLRTSLAAGPRRRARSRDARGTRGRRCVTSVVACACYLGSLASSQATISASTLARTSGNSQRGEWSMSG